MDVNLHIENKDMALVKQALKKASSPVPLDDLLHQLAMEKTQARRQDRVKMYDPSCEYEVGDLIFKLYPGKIPVGAKKYVEMDRGVVLKVAEVRERHGMQEIKLEYEGTSDFRRYTQYLERQKIELLLPHKQSSPPAKPAYLADEEDPRQKQPPLIERDLNRLRKHLLAALGKENDFAVIGDRVMLVNNLIKIEADVFEKIKEFLKENKTSVHTEFLVENFLKVKPEDKAFAANCFALNYRMLNDYKIDFQQTTPHGWGKWNLISVIYYLKKDSIMSDDNPLLASRVIADRKGLAQRRKKFEETLFADEPLRYYLSQREVTAGALRLKSGLYDFGSAVEVEAVDTATKKTYILYHYEDDNQILGFKEIYSAYKGLQGMTMIFEQVAENTVHFSIRTTKKGTIADVVEYLPESRTFHPTEEKVASPVFVSKLMFLETEVFHRVEENIETLRQIEDFNKLVHRIFLEFGNREKNYEIHVLRLYHILDLVYPVDLKSVEEVLLSNPEFIPSDKMSGVFYLDSESVVELEAEEKERREELVEEARMRREEIRRLRLEEEQKQQEEVRLKREEHRRKREEEMRLKEKMQTREDESGKAAAGRTARTSAPVDLEAMELPPDPDKMRESAKRTKPKKERKKSDEEKSRGRRPAESEKPPEKLDAEEIKTALELEKLKDEVLKKKKKKEEATRKEEVAYEDHGDFGGILGSKIESVVDEKKKPKTAAKKKSSKTRKSTKKKADDE